MRRIVACRRRQELENPLPLDRLWLRSARLRLSRWLLDEVVLAPVEPILHPSATRLRAMAFAVFTGNLVFFVLWSYSFPQPYENLPVRIAVAVLGLGYLLPFLYRDSTSRRSVWTLSLIHI